MSEAGRIGSSLPSGTRGALPNLRILIVDDSEACAKTLGWALEVMGHDVRVAYDGANGLAAALDQQPQVILLDLSMPGLNGYDLCRLMRSEYDFKTALFIAQTGWKDEEHRRLSREAGFDYYMVKPVDMIRLEQLLTAYGGEDAQILPC